MLIPRLSQLQLLNHVLCQSLVSFRMLKSLKLMAQAPVSPSMPRLGSHVILALIPSLLTVLLPSVCPTAAYGLPAWIQQAIKVFTSSSLADGTTAPAAVGEATAEAQSVDGSEKKAIPLLDTQVISGTFKVGCSGTDAAPQACVTPQNVQDAVTESLGDGKSSLMTLVACLLDLLE